MPRNRLQIGEVPQLYSGLYQPLTWSASRTDNGFASASAGAERRRLLRYTPDGGDPRSSRCGDPLLGNQGLLLCLGPTAGSARRRH